MDNLFGGIRVKGRPNCASVDYIVNGIRARSMPHTNAIRVSPQIITVSELSQSYRDCIFQSTFVLFKSGRSYHIGTYITDGK